MAVKKKTAKVTDARRTRTKYTDAVGKAIKTKLAKGMTQAEVAAQHGVSMTTLSRWGRRYALWTVTPRPRS